MSATASKTLPVDQKSDLKIAAVEVYKLRLPYKEPIKFSSLKEAVGEFVLLRLVLNNGIDGIAESVFRAQYTGENAAAAAYQIETFFKPKLLGADPLAHLDILEDLDEIKSCACTK